MSIKINNLSFTYLRKTKLAFKALDNISCSINDDSFTCIVGETGSGKSTLLEHLNALLKPDEGTIEILNYHLDKKGTKSYKELRKDVGLVFQFPETQLFEETAVKDVAYGLINFGMDKEQAYQKAKEELKGVGISENKFECSPFELSGGERRKVALAGIFVLKPKILVLDEPTVGLDPKSTKEIMEIIMKLKQQNNMSIILVTHNMDIVFEYADNVILLKNGKIEFNGSRNDFFFASTYSYSNKPFILEVIEELRKDGMNIKFDNIRTLKELVSEIKRLKK